MSYGVASVGPPVVFDALHVSQLPNYERVDGGRARCRISPSSTIVRMPNIRIGRLVRIRITLKDQTSFDVVCSLWPDSDRALETNQIVIDDSVVVGERKPWTNATCKVKTLGVHSPRYYLLCLAVTTDRYGVRRQGRVVGEVHVADGAEVILIGVIEASISISGGCQCNRLSLCNGIAHW